MPPVDAEPPVAPLPDPTARTLLVTLDGPDRPGVTKAVFLAASTVGAQVLDVEQVVVRGHLALSVLLAPGRDENVLVDRLTKAGESMGMRVGLVEGRGDNAPGAPGGPPSSSWAPRWRPDTSRRWPRPSPTTAPTSTASGDSRATP